jgi:transposase InsO family protein
MQADVSRPTAHKYLKAGKPPQEMQAKHGWRTRKDPLAEIWPLAEPFLKASPELEAKALFEHLQRQAPGQLADHHLRTFQRRVKQWRLHHGPDKEVFFPQDWEPGRAMQLDWTHATELGITIADTPYPHLLCHVVLPYSNWEWATRCQSESLLSLRHGLQEALHRLGKAPRELRVDNSSAATHRIGGEASRAFNAEFASICAHYGLEPKTIHIDCPNENGDVESGNGHLKRRLKQYLLLRGSRDFSTEGAYEEFLEEILQRGNAGRQARVAEELAVMKALPPTRLSEYDEVHCTVSSASIIRVKKVGYSVPARLIGTEVKVEVYEQELKIYSGRELLLKLPRHCGDRGVRLDYRHIVDHLLRKPGAFERYRYREELYPSVTFREAYDRLVKEQGPRRGAVEYLRLLKLASEVGQGNVELMLVEFVCPPYPPWSVEQMKQWLQPRPAAQIQVVELQPQCADYDALLNPTTLEVAYAG